MFRARQRCKILAGVLVEYVEDDFMPTTQIRTIAADRSRIRILQLALMFFHCTSQFVHDVTFKDKTINTGF